MRKTLQLDGLDCAVCAAKVEKAVKQLTGVESASLNFITQKLTLEVDPTMLDDVLARVRKVVPQSQHGCTVL